jgi:hypothetical protein
LIFLLRKSHAPIDALLKARNDIIHANKKHGFSNELVKQARDLSLWYVEMVVLRIIKYNGVYNNRLVWNQNYGKFIFVPWHQEP